MNKKNKNGNYPLLFTISENNIEMIHLLIDYANNNNIKLKLNEKEKMGIICFYWLVVIIV